MSILIGRHIQNTLRESENISQQLGRRFYPVVIPQSAPKFPCMVYTLNDTSGDQTKDGAANDSATVSMVVLHKDYDAGCVLANDIRYLFEGKSAKYPFLEVQDCQFTGYNEDWDDVSQSYIFVLNFNFNTIDI